MMAIKLVAIDVDDTLITDELVIPPACQKAIREAGAQGVEVVLATGRMFRATAPYMRELGLDGPVILYNGALIQTAAGEIIDHRPIPLDLAREIIRFCQVHHLHLNVYLADRLYVAEINEHAKYYEAMTGVEAEPVGDLLEFVTQEPTKLLIVGYEDELLPWRERLTREYAGKLEVTRSKPRYIEIMKQGISKGNALQTLAEKLGVARSEVMAIGDGFNDLPMLEWAGVGVAVANAPDLVKAKVDWIAPSNEEAGVAEAIKRFVLGCK